MQLHAVNACVKRSSQRSLDDKRKTIFNMKGSSIVDIMPVYLYWLIRCNRVCECKWTSQITGRISMTNWHMGIMFSDKNKTEISIDSIWKAQFVFKFCFKMKWSITQFEVFFNFHLQKEWLEKTWSFFRRSLPSFSSSEICSPFKLTLESTILFSNITSLE